MKYSFSCHKSPYDERDFLLKSFIKPIGLPSEYDLTKKMTPVRDQGGEGSCVGFATVVGCREYQEQIDFDTFIGLSPRFLYEEAKRISGHKEGTTLKAAMQVALNLGVCKEELWPYIPNDVRSPAPKAYQNAKQHKIKTYARVTNIEELKQAIVDPKIGPVLIGVLVFKGMVAEQCKRDGIVPYPTFCDRPIGGHALCAVGYMEESPYFKTGGHIKIKNSWGLNWGISGYGYLSDKYIKKQMLDAFSSVDIKGSPNIMTVADLPKTKESRRLWV